MSIMVMSYLLLQNLRLMKIARIKTRTGERGAPVSTELGVIVERMRSDETKEAAGRIAAIALRSRLAMEQGVTITLRSSLTGEGGSVVRPLDEEERPAWAGLTQNREAGTLTLVGRAADAGALSRLVLALAAEGLPVLGGALGEGFVRVQLPPDRLEEGLHLCHRLFLEQNRED